MDFKERLIEWRAILPLWFPAFTMLVILFLFVSALFVFRSGVVFVFFIPFVVVSGVTLFLFSFFYKDKENMDLAILKKILTKPGKFTLSQLAESSGLTVRNLERLISDVVGLGVYNICYYKPDKIVHIFEQTDVQFHCPRCAADFSQIEDSSGKCPNCKMIFSHVILKKPFYYL